MGYRKVPTIYVLHFEDPEYDGLEIRMKGLRLGRVRKLLQVSNGELGDSELDEMFELIEEGLVSWNLEDEDGTPVPTTREGLDDQEMSFVMDIVATWLDGMTGTSVDLGKGSGSGGTSPVPLPTMETL